MAKKDKKFRKAVSFSTILTATLLLILIFLKYLIPRKAFVRTSLLLTLLLVVTVISVSLFYKKKNRINVLVPLCFAIFAPFCLLFVSGFDYSFVNKEFLPLWPIPLIISLIIGAAITVKWLWQNTRVLERIGYFVFIAFVSFLVLWNFALHLNCALDFSKPEQCVAIIEEKDIDAHRRSPTTYSFKVSIDGKSYSLRVSMLEYEQYEVGDVYIFEMHNGAFKLPFYISSPASNNEN